MDTPAESSRPLVRSGSGARSPWARGADWTVGVTAGALLLISLGGWLYHRSQLADLAADHLRLQVIGPAKLRPGLDNEYSVMTTSVAGTPVSAEVEFVVRSPDEKRLMDHKEKTDENGRLKVTIPADLEISGGVALEVAAGRDGWREKVATRLAIEPIRYASYLALDKPMYRPGESIHYRSLTLSRFRLAADRPMPVEFEILDPGGAPVAGLQAESVTQGGVACGRFSLPPGLAGGKYTLVARSLDGAFPDERRTFFVRRYRLPGLIATLKFTRSSYLPGDTAIASLSAQRVEGGAAAGADLQVAATLDGQVIHEEAAEVSSHGTFQIEFSLPTEFERGEGQLVVVVDDGGLRETITTRIPLQAGPIDVSFFPEGGELVAGLENRVYLTARDRRGTPVDVRGTVVDGQGRRVVDVATSYRGMGKFSIVPEPGEDYRLVLGDTAERRQVVRLPEVSTDRQLVLSTSLGVFQEGAPLEFNVRALEAGMPLVAAAWCRGLPVGRQAFITDQKKANPVTVPLDDEAGGVIRLTIYDYRAHPPEPVAERLFYRPPARRLQVRVEANRDGYSPGERIEVPLAVTDEEDAPLEATLAVRLVPEALRSLAEDRPPTMPTYFLLATELAGTEDLGDPEFYSGESREAAVALDLLLGTQGWRRFLESSLGELGEGARERARLERLAALGGAANPPAVFDNLVDLQQGYRESLAKYRANRTRASNTLTALSFFGGVGLVMLVAMLSLLNIASGARLWATAIVVATVCLVVGGILLDPGRWKSSPEGGVPFLPFDMAPATLPIAVEPPPNSAGDPGQRKTAQSGEGEDQATPGVVRSDAKGRTQAEFESPGPVGRLRVLVDGHAEGGRIGHGMGEVAVRAPFQLAARLPSEVSPGDRIDVPLAILNDTDDKLSAEIVVEHSGLVELGEDGQRQLELEPNGRTRCWFPITVVEQGGEGRLTFRATAGQLADEVTCPLEVVPPEVSESGQESGQGDVGACPVRLSTRLERNQVAWGQSVALTAELANATDASQPMTVAVLGLPAGLESRLDGLEALRRVGKIDYYETRPRQVICYWRTLAPNERIEWKLDLIAAVPGKFTGPAPRAFLHDAPDQKHGNEPLAVEITRD